MGEGQGAHTGQGTKQLRPGLAGGFESVPRTQGLTVTLKVMAFCRPSGETCSSSATAWISRALTTEATSCASVCKTPTGVHFELNKLFI